MSETRNHIAIIGMTCRLPGANDIDTYWKNLCEGVESISFFSEQESLAEGVDPELLKNPNYVRAAGIVDNAEEFDPSLFNMSPRETTLTDPQHRILLECGWEVLEKAGYNPRTYDGMIGVFVGSGASSYLVNNIIPSHYWQEPDDRYELQFENFFGYLSLRLSHKLHLKGPSFTIQTSCSTSLAAAHLACQSLLNYECDMALAGGTCIQVPQHKGYLYQPESILSPDGHCRVFDSKAAGTVFSNGVGLVVLKRLDDAINDGDCIDAVILGSAVNNDGNRKHGFTAPSAEGQAEVAALAQAMAEVRPDMVRFIETHGTGTLLGDPIELTGLKKVFNIKNKNHCALGAVKSNIGHTDAAAGIAGLIKAALAVKHGVIPPCINFDNPNPALQLESSPFFINKERMDWPDQQGDRIAGIGSFGMGGANAHAVIKQPPEPAPRKAMTGPSVIVLSAASEKSLQKSEANLENFLLGSRQDHIKDIAYTLQVGRVPLAYRRAIVCQDSDDLLATLRGDSIQDSVVGTVIDSAKSVAFMFTGQGSQYVNMGRDLYEKVDMFRTTFDQCADLLQLHLGQDIRSLLYVISENEKETAETLRQTGITQPLLFAFEYALAKTWKAWGIEPASLIGHSIGEYVAACLAGVMSLEDALSIVAERGRLIQSLPGGTMLMVSLPEDKVTQWLGDNISLAAVNAPDSCVLSGETPAIDKLADELEKEDISCGKLHTSHAFHSFMMEPILSSFRERLASIQLSKPSIPFISNVTGKWITDEEATSPDYWVRHIRQAVRFSDGIQCLADSHKGFLLEVGPGNTLSSLSRKHSQTSDLKILASVRHPKNLVEDDTFIYRTLSSLWVEGCDVKWSRLPDADNCRRVRLPTYPFDKKRYWVEPDHQMDPAQPKQFSGKYIDIEKWFYQPTWKRASIVPSRVSNDQSPKTWLILAHAGPALETLKAELATQGDTVIPVLAGSEFKQDENQFTIDTSRYEHYEQVFSKIHEQPSQFIHALNVTASSGQAGDKGMVDSCYSLLNLSKAIGSQEQFATGKEPVLNVLTQGAEDVLGSEEIDPESSLAAGIIRVHGQEYPHCFTRHFDFSIEEVSKTDTDWIKTLASDLRSNINARTVAYRNQQRWQPEIQNLDLSGSVPKMLRPNGVYLITGGLGNIGLTIGQYLAEKVSARLVLFSRSKLPPREEWDAIIAQGKDATLIQRLKKILNIEKAGGAVHTLSADISNIDDMTELMDLINKKFGALNGVIHSSGFVDMNACKFIPDINQQDVENQFAPKVEGIKVLTQALGKTKLDFCMMVSSLSVQLGGLGYSVYSSANHFLDAFAHKMRREGLPWFSVNWDSWLFEIPEPTGKKLTGGSLATYSITPDEGMRILDKVFSAGDQIPVLCVSTGDLSARYKQSVLMTEDTPPQTQAKPSHFTEQPVTSIESDPSPRNDFPRNETEKILVEIWQTLLGLDHVGIKDNFFELGGDSMIGLRLTSRIRKQLNVELSINELFQMPTISELAPTLMKTDKPSDNGSDEANQLREKIDQMTPEQISELLKKKEQERNN